MVIDEEVKSLAGERREQFRRLDCSAPITKIRESAKSNGSRTNGTSAGTAPTKTTQPTGTSGAWREVARYLMLNGMEAFCTRSSDT